MKFFSSHLFSFFCRSLSVNTAVLYFTSVFISTQSGENLSRVLFYSAVGSTVIYLALNFIHERFIYRIYLVLAALLIPVAGLQIFGAEGSNTLYMMGILLYIVDFVGPSTQAMALQLSSNPIVFRDGYQKMQLLELYGRIASACIIWVLGRYELLPYYFIVFVIGVALHIWGFGRFLSRQAFQEEAISAGSVVKQRMGPVKRSLSFIYSNPLVRTAMLILVWTNLNKFLIEYIYVQSMASAALDDQMVPQIVSSVSLAALLTSTAFQKFISPRLFDRFSFAPILISVPIGILLFASTALVYNSMYPLIGLFVFFQVVNRGIQLPISRQCFMPVPRQIRKSITVLSILVAAVSGLVISAMLSIVKHWIELPGFIGMTMILSVCIMFMLTNLDSHYIRNLWSSYRERRQGTWLDGFSIEDTPVAGVFEDKEVAFEIERETVFDVEQTRAGLLSDKSSLVHKARLVLLCYGYATDNDLLRIATDIHRSWLKSETTEEKVIGLKLLSELSIPESKIYFDKARADSRPEVRETARVYETAGRLLDGFPLKGTTSFTRRKIKSVLIELLKLDSSEDKIKRLQLLAEKKGEGWIAPVVDIMAKDRSGEMRETILGCVKWPTHQLTIEPLLKELEVTDFQQSDLIRSAILAVGTESHRAEVEAFMSRHLNRLVVSRFSVWRADVPADEKMDILMKLLFLEEQLMEFPEKVRTYMNDTLADLRQVAREDLEIVIDIHIEYLKQSRLFIVWRALLDPKASDQDYAEASKVLIQQKRHRPFGYV